MRDVNGYGPDMERQGFLPSPPVGTVRGPEEMRTVTAEFVHVLHGAYLDRARLLAPADRARLPLLSAGNLTVAVAAARQLHLVATSDAFPAPAGPEVALDDELAGLAWTVRFFDPVVLPELGILPDDGPGAPAEVRRVLGVACVVYHLAVSPGGGLTAHHAQHAGTGLANQHAAAARDYESLQAALPRRSALVDELAVAERAGLPNAVRLLAGQILPEDDDVSRVLTDPTAPTDDIRRALLAAVRRDATKAGIDGT